MWPRLFSRGKAVCTCYIDGQRYRFNVAAAVQPRKGDIINRGPSEKGPLQCGRGCSAAERGTGGHERAERDHASMWPRLFSRGKKGGGDGRKGFGIGLQCGRGCSAAESQAIGRKRSDDITASMWP